MHNTSFRIITYPLTSSLTTLALCAPLTIQAGALSDQAISGVPLRTNATAMTPALKLVAPNTPGVSNVLHALTFVGSRMSFIEATKGNLIRPSRAEKDLQLVSDALMDLDLSKAKHRAEAMIKNQNIPLRKRYKKFFFVFSALLTTSISLFKISQRLMSQRNQQRTGTLSEHKSSPLKLTHLLSLGFSVVSAAGIIRYGSKLIDTGTSFNLLVATGVTLAFCFLIFTKHPLSSSVRRNSSTL